MQLENGQSAPNFVVNDIWGNTIDLARMENKNVLLCFFRYAECAVCQLRIAEIMREKENFKKQNIEVIAVFQSSVESLKKNIVDKTHFDFTLIADEDRTLYKLYKVNASWLKTFKTLSIKGITRIIESKNAGFSPGGKVEGLMNQIPADFIIGLDKRILVAKYGDNVIDHIPLTDILNKFC